MKELSSKNIETKCVHAGIEEHEFGPVIPPIYQTSTFRFESAKHGASLFAGEEKGYIYTRMLNPTIEAMENSIAALESGHKALGCASGMAAIHTVIAALTSSGDHVICSASVYGPTITLLETIFKKFGVESSFVDTSDPGEVRKALKKNTRVVYVETPGNPTLSLSDINIISEIAAENNASLVVDNTFLSPVLQQPLKLGADIVIHSLTKFLNGHADVVGGVIIVKDEESYLKMRKVLNQLGGVIDPFNAFLVHRGIKTLALRMNRHSESALIIAEYLEKHPSVSKVYFPGLKSHPQFQLGQKQHKDGMAGGVISFELKGGYEAGTKVMDSVQLCQLAVSLGGVESLIQHPASMTHFSMGREARLKAGISDGLVRLSVGIESPEDIIEDLESALSGINTDELQNSGRELQV